MTQVATRLKTFYADHGEKLRFLLVGGWNTVFSYALFALLYKTIGPSVQALAGSSSAILGWMGEHYYLVIQWLTWIVAVPQSTTALKYLCFHSKGHLGHEIGRSFFVYLPMQAISSLTLWLLVKFAGLNPLVGQLLTIAISAVLSYFGHKYFTFKTPAKTLSSSEAPAED